MFYKGLFSTIFITLMIIYVSYFSMIVSIIILFIYLEFILLCHSVFSMQILSKSRWEIFYLHYLKLKISNSFTSLDKKMLFFLIVEDPLILLVSKLFSLWIRGFNVSLNWWYFFPKLVLDNLSKNEEVLILSMAIHHYLRYPFIEYVF